MNDIWRLRQLNVPPLTQRDLARLLQVDKKDVGAWERGEVMPSLPTVARLAAVLHTTAEELYYETFEDAYAWERDREHAEGPSPVKRPPMSGSGPPWGTAGVRG